MTPARSVRVAFLLSGVAGLAYGAMHRQAGPFDIVGDELNVIAAVVLVALAALALLLFR